MLVGIGSCCDKYLRRKSTGKQRHQTVCFNNQLQKDYDTTTSFVHWMMKNDRRGSEREIASTSKMKRTACIRRFVQHEHVRVPVRLCVLCTSSICATLLITGTVPMNVDDLIAFRISMFWSPYVLIRSVSLVLIIFLEGIATHSKHMFTTTTKNKSFVAKSIVWINLGTHEKLKEKIYVLEDRWLRP